MKPQQKPNGKHRVAPADYKKPSKEDLDNPPIDLTADQVLSSPSLPTSYGDLCLHIKPLKTNKIPDEKDMLIANLNLSPKGPRICKWRIY